jgi:uncharacterized membrane protein YuzA (DUF378 family)
MEKSKLKIATILIQNAVRVLGLALIGLGFLFWTGHSSDLIPLHMWLGETLCALLWILAILGFVEHLNRGLIVSALVWGLLALIFGMNMGKLLPGRAHELIRVLHFLVGLAAIGLAEMLAARIKRKLRTASVPGADIGVKTPRPDL